MYRKLHRAPWLLATSLPHERGCERRIKQLYAMRMQIEEMLRDNKSHRWGFGLRYARSSSAHRIEVLLLIAALASLVLWLVGLAGRAQNLARDFRPTPFDIASCSPLRSSVACSWSDGSPSSRPLYSINRSLSFALLLLSLDSHDFAGIPQQSE